MTPLPDNVRRLIDGANFATISLNDAGAAPHTSVVWLDREGDTLRVNTAEGRKKPRLMRADGKVSLAVIDREDPYKWALVRGTVTTITTDGARDHIDVLAKKYLDADTYPFYKGETRLTALIEVDEVVDLTGGY